jgi:hypothetical protein
VSWLTNLPKGGRRLDVTLFSEVSWHFGVAVRPSTTLREMSARTTSRLLFVHGPFVDVSKQNACTTLAAHVERSRLIANCELPVAFGSFTGYRRTDGWQNPHWRRDKNLLKKQKMKH